MGLFDEVVPVDLGISFFWPVAFSGCKFKVNINTNERFKCFPCRGIKHKKSISKVGNTFYK